MNGLARPCRRPGCSNVIPESAHANRRYCGVSECETERARAAGRAAYRRNQGPRSKQIKAYNQANRAEERRRYHERYRVRKLARSYQIPMEEMQKLLELEGCAICGATDRRMVTDHCHESGRVRGRLCDNCNRGIGLIGDDPDLLRRAANYLEVSRAEAANHSD